jgi:Antibiotic biosynthesis monooxygenase
MPSSTTTRSSNIGKFQRTDVDSAFARATDGFVSRASGFISSTLHRSVDGTKVAMYAQWRSVEDYQTMCQEPGPLPFLQEALSIAKFEPGIYESVLTFLPIGG